jgi:hypothetical protein
METAGESILADKPTSPRDAFNGWFVTHEVAWELAMAALASFRLAKRHQLADVTSRAE